MKAAFQAAFKALVFILLPVILISGLNQYFSEADLATRISRERDEMAQILSAVSAQAEPQQRFDKAFAGLAGLDYPSDSFTRRLQQMLAANPGALEVFLFDAAGNCQTLPFLPVPPKFVAQKFLECVLMPSLSIKYERFVMQFSGYRSAHALLSRTPDAIIKIGASNDRKWGGWFRLHGSDEKFAGHLLVFIRKSALTQDSLLEEAIAKARVKHGRNYCFAWQDPVEPRFLRPAGLGFASDTVALVNSIPYGETSFVCSSRPGLKVFTDAGVAIIARTLYPVDEGHLFRAVRFFLKLFSALIFLILMPVFMGITSFNPGLKIRLIAIFLFGAGVPLVILFFTGIADRSEREKVLVNDYQDRNIEELTRIDEGISNDYRVLETVFKSMVKKSSLMPEKEFSASLKTFGELFSFSAAMRQVLIVKEGESLTFTREKKSGEKADEKESMVLYGKMLLETLNGKYLAESGKTDPDGLKSVVNNLGAWLARSMIMNSGKIGMLNLLDNVRPTYANFFIDHAYNARAMIFIFMEQSGLQRNYLLKISKLRDQLHTFQQPKFMAVPLAISPFWPAFPKRSTAENPVLRRLVDQVIRGGVPVHETATIGARKYLLSAAMGGNLDGYVLVMAQPYEAIAGKLQVFRRNLQILSVLVILVALFSASVTSSLLLKPLSTLRTGLQAFSNGNFRIQLPGATVSEFSSMLGSLNRTMNNFQELQVARSVQETLWPEGPLSGNDWYLCGRCITATELGGDHYDWMQLRDGRILIVIGDVTGHGIAPAMVQASTKVWLAINAEKCSDAVSLLQEISRLHFDYGARRLYMTCWLGYYTPDTGKLEYASAGHPYPIIISAEGSTEMLKLPGMPLGIKAKPQIFGDSRMLGAGDSLVLYTDGIVEVRNKANEMLGFDGFADICRQTALMPAPVAIDHIFSAATLWGIPNDDQTIIVLKRQAAGVDNANC